MSVRAIEAEVSIKSGVQAECTIGREVIVEVHEEVNLESLTATANGQYSPAEGVDGFSDVTVSVPERIPVTESLSVTENGLYEPTEGIDGYDSVTVAVPPTIPEIEALTVSEDGVYQASGDGYNPVTVNTGVASLRQEIADAETASGCSPLTDGITALTTYANEVTGQEDATLSDAVETLASGYGKSQNLNPFKYAIKLIETLRGAVLPKRVVVDFEGNSGITTMNYTFRDVVGCEHIVLKNLASTCTFTALCYAPSYKTITFENCDDFRPTTIQFSADTNLEEIIGEIDMSACQTANSLFSGCKKLRTVRFKPNTIGVELGNFIGGGDKMAFTTESWISIANALRADTPNIIYTRQANRNTLLSIIGRNDSGMFVLDEEGTMSLLDFITNIKGWTIGK